RHAAYLTGPGLVSTNMASCSGSSTSCSSSARFQLPERHAFWNSAHRRGATFDVTEMQPLPPCALNPSAVASSPERYENGFLISSLCCDMRSTLAEASFTPATFFRVEIRARVAGRISTTVRGGTL